MTRTTVMLPEALKLEAKQRAKELGLSMGELIRKALRDTLDDRTSSSWKDDPLFRDVPLYEGSTPRDLSSDPDRYLYGDDV